MGFGTHIWLNSRTAFKRTLPESIDSEPRPKKCRKGTQSCWACKRRKVRCSFSKGESTCDGCKIRNTACIGQEYPDKSSKVDGNSPLHERLSRVEALVDRVARKIDLSDEMDNAASSPDVIRRRKILADETGELPTPRRSPEDTSIDQQPSSGFTDEHHDICLRLLKAWPDQYSLDALLNVSGEVLGMCHGIICAPIAKVRYTNRTILQDMKLLPSPDSHPVLIARKLLKLAIYLQNLSAFRKERLDGMGIDHGAIKTSAYEAVRRCVTSNEDLLSSIEGIECLVLEVMYLSTCGKLRGAWHSIRRAKLIGQLMGLHRVSSMRSIKTLEPDDWSGFDPKYLWFRLTQTNRYFSLMLGLFQGTPNNSFAESRILDSCSPLARMQRLDCVVGGHILQRNEFRLYDTGTTHMIDQLLRQSAACLPSSWWTAPELRLRHDDLPSAWWTEPDVKLSRGDDDAKTLEDVIRMMDQLTHFHLVTQLHLPHLLERPTEHEFDYSRTVAMDSSREVLARYTSQGDSHSFTSWCRGISLLALVSCVAMCIVHVGAKHQRQDGPEASGALSTILGDQYQDDRNLMKLTLDCMRKIAREDKDAVASKTASIVQKLLSMEADSVVFEEDDPDASSDDFGYEFGCDSHLSEGGRTLRILIASFGTLKFESSSHPGP